MKESLAGSLPLREGKGVPGSLMGSLRVLVLVGERNAN